MVARVATSARYRIALLCLNTDVLAARKRLLEKLGFRVEPAAGGSSRLVGKLTSAAPLALVVDLDVKPAYGRDIAIYLRNTQSVRHVPLVFAGGVKEKVARVEAEIPDAVYCTWDEVKAGVEAAIAAPPVRPVRPTKRGEEVLHGASLAKKFGIRSETQLAILGDVIGLGERLELEYEQSLGRRTNLALVVVRSERELTAAFEALAARLPLTAAVWMIHPKQSGRLKPDFTQKDILHLGLRFGFTGFKMCSVDTDWSGLRLVRKKRV
jgi:CheY-like chemotaxis protein